ncbi:MAG TPA: 3'(2'),5'-bisphosphate nucleotidase CysQ [Nitrospiraceae bacterium]|nr:3'(2'),5'-bisphosphate nucleotidase CysQ [Nitrospiraceae bacterium]
MDHEIDIMGAAAIRAGTRVLELASEGFEIHTKNDRSPVTTADLEVNRILHEDLLGAYPDHGWLSEETADNPDRLEKKRVWIIDPIDGTKYFMRGVPQYTISIALAEGTSPIAAVVYNPASGEFFSAVRGSGARLNGQPIAVRDAQQERPVILVSPPAWERGRFNALAATAECRPMGSIAYTLALVAAGQADGALNIDRLNEWDIAAGVLLIGEAGGKAVDSAGNPLLFNQPRTAVQGIIASHAHWHGRMAGWVDLLS